MILRQPHFDLGGLIAVIRWNEIRGNNERLTNMINYCFIHRFMDRGGFYG